LAGVRQTPAVACHYGHANHLAAMVDLNAPQIDLTKFIAAVIRECRDDGMVMPFIVCAVSPNGSVVVSRVGSGDEEPLAEHYEARGFSVPMTIVIVDQENTTAKATTTS
jgi:hypothetical protein